MKIRHRRAHVIAFWTAQGFGANPGEVRWSRRRDMPGKNTGLATTTNILAVAGKRHWRLWRYHSYRQLRN
jgi:hypothetical protein